MIALSKRVWSGLSNPNKLPRRLWFPTTRLLDLGTEEWQRQHDEVSISLKRTMLTLLGYCFFCVLTLAAPDVSLIAKDANIQVPFAGTKINYQAFLIIGPLVIFGLTIYLHILLGHLLSLGKKKDTLGLPYIFNIDSRAATWLANCIFYWTPCLVLAYFSWKAIPRAKESLFLSIQTAIFFSYMVLLKIRRFPDDRHRFKFEILYFFSWLVGVCILFGAQIGLYERSLDLFRADLQNKDLRNSYLFKATLKEANLNGANLRGAYLVGANLNEANLMEADLEGANLEGAKLREANLVGANLRKANLGESDNICIDCLGSDLGGATEAIRSDFGAAVLRGADLTGANLVEANLMGVILERANLREANLKGAKLTSADLRNTRGLTIEQICSASAIVNYNRKRNLESELGDSLDQKPIFSYKVHLDPALDTQIEQECPNLLKEPKKENLGMPEWVGEIKG